MSSVGTFISAHHMSSGGRRPKNGNKIQEGKDFVAMCTSIDGYETKNGKRHALARGKGDQQANVT